MRRQNSTAWAVLTVCPLLLVAAMCLSGCKPQEITVTIKPVAGEGEEDAAEAEGEGEAAAEGAGGFGNFTGAVTYDGDVPSLPLVINSGDQTVKDASVCSVADIPDESLLVNPDSKGIANVVVYLDKRPKNINPDLATPPEEPVVFDQKGCRFLPHVLTVQIGQPLIIKSDDSIAHNTHTYPVRNESFNSVIGANDRTGVPCKYTKAENAPIEVKCDLHPWMRSYHFPVDHPYVAITDTDGKFTISGLPAGKHTFKVWHEKGELLERKLEVTIEADADATRELKYGADKFAGVPVPAGRTVAYQRLQQGGPLVLTQVDGRN